METKVFKISIDSELEKFISLKNHYLMVSLIPLYGDPDLYVNYGFLVNFYNKIIFLNSLKINSTTGNLKSHLKKEL